MAEGKLETMGLKGRWESYVVQLVKEPLDGVKQALVIAGSDRRGTAYGLLSVSRAIGVSPWYWWIDAPVKKQNRLYLKVKKMLSKEPSVKYRGIFINDEDWGLYRWAKLNFERNVVILALRPMPKCVNCYCVCKLIICAPQCMMHLLLFIVCLKTDW